ncbi:putative DNA repair protein [Desulforapulum autotrophicum HRM2]|uniref:DNA repair protein n=1 Tax=Desulforapulum autotrophicum (strain ATCC 43914 / DSM 3382 / VKM B-1955 / HRM2) TaxID=177437 RepID=C0QHV3_DESAH|nr:CRISPR-associated endonuclease Cas6 [Desulforapulum autotrophicum]ACN13661.1 putative DNA repair protein [Desulforapulum autotrophicum HRM2]
MKRSILYFNNIRLNTSEIHKFRGYIGNMFREHDLIHNHDAGSGRPIYRYPLIQFKLIDNIPAIIALTDRAVQVFADIFMATDEIVIDGRTIPVAEKDLAVQSCEFGFSTDTYMYEFLSPWIGLNQMNHRTYASLKEKKEKNELLKRILTGNILSMAKYLDVRLEPDQRIRTALQLKQTKVTLKGTSMVGFKGIFKTNFMVPDYAGLGKSVSRGFGTIKKLL